MTEGKIENRLKYLTYYSAFITLLLLTFIFAAFKGSGKKTFEEINVERINVVEPNGQPALVIANSEHLPPAIIEGDTLAYRKGIPGIIFYNSEGDESGGLIFDTQKTDSTLSAFGHLSFDRFKQDQVLKLQYVESPTERYTGLTIKDQPKMNVIQYFDLLRARAKGDQSAKQKLERLEKQGKLSADRVFIGTKEDASTLMLHDTYGNLRIRIAVDSFGVPSIEFLNKKGEVTYSLPPEK